MTNKLYLRCLSALVLVALTVACGQPMQNSAAPLGKVQDDGDGGTNNQTPDLQFEKIEAETAAAEAAVRQAEAEVSQILKGGKIVLPGESSNEDDGWDDQVGGEGVVSAKSLFGLADRLEEFLNKIYDKLMLPVQKARDVIAQARAKLVDALAKLDPSNPLYQKLIEKINELTARLDSIEGRFSGVYQLLASKVDFIIDRVDDLIDKLDSGNPLLWIPLMELKDIRDVLVDFRDRLANT